MVTTHLIQKLVTRSGSRRADLGRCNAKYLYRNGGCGHAFVDHSKLSEKVKGAARLTVLDATPLILENLPIC